VGDIAFHQRCMRKIHDLRARGTTILFVSHATSDVKALCERCLWLQNGVVQELGEADEVVAKYLSAALHRETLHRAGVRKETLQGGGEGAAAGWTAPASATELVAGSESTRPGYRYGDGRATIIGADLVVADHVNDHIQSRSQSIRTVTPLDRLILKLSFRVNAEMASPIAGFLVRNHRGENIFGSNTARENYPLPPMMSGDAQNVDFHWSAPGLAPGAYRISLAVADGNIEEFQMCDYVEDAIELRAAANGESNGDALGGTHRGYFDLHCAAVTIHRNERCK